MEIKIYECFSDRKQRTPRVICMKIEKAQSISDYQITAGPLRMNYVLVIHFHLHMS
jgi:hypothetical protein